MTFEPLNKNVLVEPIKATERSRGGILLPEVKGAMPRGKVRAVAADVEGVAAGDVVVYRTWSEIMVGDEHLHVVESKDLLGIERA